MTPPLAYLREFARDERGATAVEFTIIAVPLVLILVGLIDFGRALYTRNNMIEAADVGARIILLDNAASDAAIADSVRDAFLAAPDDELAVSLGTASESGIQFRTIGLSHEFDLLVPLPAVGRVSMEHTRRVPLE